MNLILYWGMFICVIMATDKSSYRHLYRRTDGLPQFNEWFEDYGMNKVTHVMELRAAGYGIN